MRCKTNRAHAREYLYSSYDALITINVPGDKARAVVDAMERDMASTIATKTDLQLLGQELLTGMAGLATRSELNELKAEMAALKLDIRLVRKDLELLSSQLTVRLGAMLAVGLGLLFAALRFG
jgi:hypothetical protein